MKKYTVWSRRRRHFATLEEACQYAANYFRATGDVVAVTSYSPRSIARR